MKSPLKNNRLVIGARGSTLSLAQIDLVTEALKKQYPELAVELKIIKTSGDLNQSISLTNVGKSWFTAEIEQALLDGEIDIAVHCLKDMSLQAPEGLKTVIVLRRGDPRDVLISKLGKSLLGLPSGAIIGTDSVRRKVLILDKRPDLVVKSIRGNIDTRIKKMHSEDYDAIVLAVAGLERIGVLDEVATEFFDLATFLPSPGQGVLAVQAHADRSDIFELLECVQDKETRIEAETELAFSRAVGGGCKTPIGCLAQIKGDTIYIDAMVGNLATNATKRKSASGPVAEAGHLAEALAKEML